MPQYTVTDPQSGKSMTLTGDSPPTEAELTEIFGKVNAAPAAAPESKGFLRRAGDTVGDVALGAAKKLGETGLRGGALLRKIPGVQALDNALGNPGVDINTAPTNTAQKVGGALEQVAEVVAPSRAVAGLGVKAAEAAAPTLARYVGARAATLAPRMAVEAAGGGSLAAMQGANPVVGAALGGLVPAAGEVFNGLAPKLREAAAKQVVTALGPTKERFKAMAERLTPEILQRGLRGSREALQAQAADTASEVGGKIDSAIQAYGARQVDTTPVLDALEQAKGAFQTTGPHGKAVIFEPRAVKQLDGLQQVITDLGPEARVDQLVAVRRAWDKVVDQAGGFAHRAGGAIGVPLKDQSEAWAKREATGAIRTLLNADVPELGALNKEFSFWKNLDGVLTQTLQRTQPQGPGLAKAGAEIVGGLAGASHGPAGAVGGAYALGKVQQMFKSARWQLASAQVKDRLATAIVNNDASGIATALSRIGAVESAKVPAMVSGP